MRLSQPGWMFGTGRRARAVVSLVVAFSIALTLVSGGFSGFTHDHGHDHDHELDHAHGSVQRASLPTAHAADHDLASQSAGGETVSWLAEPYDTARIPFQEQAPQDHDPGLHDHPPVVVIAMISQSSFPITVLDRGKVGAYSTLLAQSLSTALERPPMAA